MENNNKTRKNKFLAMCLSVMMVASAGAALAACSDDAADSSSTSSSSSSTEAAYNDTGLIKNSGFETPYTMNASNAILKSVTGWTSSVNSTTSGTANSSKAMSGVIDISDAEWKKLTTSYFENPDDAKALTEEKAEELWDKLTIKDKLAFYDAWKEANEDGDIDEDLEFYEAFNIDSGDIPEFTDMANFTTHHKEGETGYGKDYKVLMIHNEYPEKSDESASYKALGTAQKFTSSSTVTVPAGASAQFSVWVKTADLKCSDTQGNPQTAVGKGAYITVNQSVGGTALDVYQVKNINTETMPEAETSNGWAQYSFYLKGSSYTSTTFSIVLGLGQGGGTDRLEYVNGYAFFDDIQCEIISNETYDDKLVDNGINEDDVVKFETEKENKTVDVASKSYTGEKAFAFDFYGEFLPSPILSNLTADQLKDTTSELSGKIVSSLAGKETAWLGGGFDGSKDDTTVYAGMDEFMTAAGVTTDSSADDFSIPENPAKEDYLKSIYFKHFQGNDFVTDDDDMLMLMSANGVAYTAESSYEFSFKDSVTGDVHDYMAISFFVKTSDLNGFTGAGVTLTHGNNKTSFTSIDTTDVTPVAIGEDEDVYDGWQQCFFFVQNETEDPDATFTLTFNFGPTEFTKSTTKSSFYSGFAAFTKFETRLLNEDEYNSVSSGTYAKLATLSKADMSAAGNSGFDSATTVGTRKIDEGIANLKNYKGVYSDSYYVTPPTAESTDDEATQLLKTSINLHENAGLVNRTHFEEYYTADAAKAPVWMQGLTALTGETTADKVWKSAFGNATQPLLIWNDGANEKAYGFIGKSTSIAANTYSMVSLRVKTNAVANVYLIDTDEGNFQNTLKVTRNLTYWYDENGNICAGDPTEKKTQVAFELRSNGLYKANTKWSGYSKLPASLQNEYFANLSAYGEDSDGNKVIAENGATHAYTDAWNNVGESKIVFYKSGDKYYADEAKSTVVYDLKSVTITEATPDNALPCRYEETESAGMQYTVENTGDDWVTVTFIIHTGDSAKNYRLEVWSGDRANGDANAAGTYVMVDTNNPGTAETLFNDLLTLYKDKEGVTSFEGIFSFFDTDSFRRYDSSLDDNNVTNLYKESEGYNPYNMEKGVAYLEYLDGKDYRVLADFQYSERTVVKTEVNDETTDDSSSDSSTAPAANPWMLASSIVVAVVLLAVIVLIIIRNVKKEMKKNQASKPAAPTPAKPTREAQKPAAPAPKKQDNADDEDSPYND